ncbi:MULTISPECIES: hypothetical protein [unclassified Bradyrhizobium]|uniref:hypothetical protein n=1 Tax=unclassified Bradyrhizobium TaxID=2631580 RepID=UPI00201BA6C0|nr:MULTISPECIES: hypothetical protein [unclassified Bradyrhizobium]
MMLAAHTGPSIRRIDQSHCAGRTRLKFKPSGTGTFQTVPQLWGEQGWLYEPFVVDPKPLNEKASLGLTFRIPRHVTGFARKHNRTSLLARD